MLEVEPVYKKKSNFIIFQKKYTQNAYIQVYNAIFDVT